MTTSPSLSVGTVPRGLSFRYSGTLTSPLEASSSREVCLSLLDFERKQGSPRVRASAHPEYFQIGFHHCVTSSWPSWPFAELLRRSEFFVVTHAALVDIPHPFSSPP